MPNTPIHSRVNRLLWERDGNCFLWGCVTIVVVFILGTIVAFIGLGYGVGQLREKFTDDMPIELPVVEMPADEREALIERVDEFAEALREGGQPDPLTLTQDELNVLLQNHPEVEDWGEYVYITIEEDDSLTGQVSVPLDFLDFLPGFGDRYFNGSVKFEASIENGRMMVFVNEATLNGEPVPEKFMEQVRGENIADEISSDPEAADLFDKVDSLVVTDGVIRITPVLPESSDEVIEEEAVEA